MHRSWPRPDSRGISRETGKHHGKTVTVADMTTPPGAAVGFDGLQSVFGAPVPFDVRWRPEERQWEVRLAHLSVPGLPEGLRRFAENALRAAEDGRDTDGVDIASDGATALNVSAGCDDDGAPLDVYALATFDFPRGFHAVSNMEEPLYGADGCTGAYLDFHGEGIDRAGFAARARELLAMLDEHPDAGFPYTVPVVRAELGRLVLSTVDEQWWLRLSSPAVKKPLPERAIADLAAAVRASAGKVLLLAELGYRMTATVEAGRLTVRIASPAPDGGEYALETDLGEVSAAAVANLP